MQYPRTAVVIEDDPDIGNLVCGVLTTSGLSMVRLVETGVKGAAAVRDLSPAIVILDYGLPDISGFEVIRQLRTFSSAPILMLTGQADLTDQLLTAGASTVLTKPFRVAVLRARVEEVLRLGQRKRDQIPGPPVPDIP
ncbi:response regulator transcription factor [Arthrobacter sp. SAFR-179]|uniref:response regulator transcription factor n=1 Tax=Arthrobacter sp. SAFR-179 TaxID=3387279 RepID=UPI003F7C15B9